MGKIDLDRYLEIEEYVKDWIEIYSNANEITLTDENIDKIATDITDTFINMGYDRISEIDDDEVADSVANAVSYFI
ncbi:hypothetical protein [Bacillus niameyensis]|uniref:hypothetical protein n=1 Tax=Bacillus niameyensis TaxID=1522308 RepID=UPI000B049446|nr:hypothetical protein [Bacillus niameyensis]